MVIRICKLFLISKSYYNSKFYSIALDGGHGGKPTERTIEGFPRVAFL